MKNTTHLTKVGLDVLTIDPRVQRREGVDDRRVTRMAEHFKPHALGTITVSMRDDGSLVILDGAHRTAAARQIGYKDDLPATVIAGLTLEQEAEIFLLLNDFKSPSIISRFYARVVMGDPVAVDIHRILEAHGWKVIQSNDAGCIASIGTIERVYRNAAGTQADGEYPEVLDYVLDVLTAAWEYDGKGVTQHHLLAIAQLFGRFGQSIDTKKLVTEMSYTRPDVLLGKGKVLRDVQGGTVSAAIAKILVGAHNKGRRTNLLPEWVWVR